MVVDGVSDLERVLTGERIPAGDYILLTDRDQVVRVLFVEPLEHVVPRRRYGSGRHIAGCLHHHGGAFGSTGELDELPGRFLFGRVLGEYHAHVAAGGEPGVIGRQRVARALEGEAATDLTIVTAELGRRLHGDAHPPGEEVLEHDLGAYVAHLAFVHEFA